MSKIEIYVGGTTGRTSATDYTSRCIRCSYTKEFLNDYSFDAIFEGVDASDTKFTINNNFFVCLVNDSSVRFLLLKGYINDINWSSRDRVEIKGKQSQRVEAGSNTMLSGVKVPDGTNVGDIPIGTFAKEAGDDGEGTWWTRCSSNSDSSSGQSKKVLGRY